MNLFPLPSPCVQLNSCNTFFEIGEKTIMMILRV
jgi:hypothetical protein